MKIGFAGTGYINKIHAQAAKNLGLDLVAIVNHKQGSMAEFGERFNIMRQYEKINFDGYAIRDRIVKTAKEMVK